MRGNGEVHRKIGGGERGEQGRGFQEEPATIGKIFRETSVKGDSAARPKQRRTGGTAMAVKRWPAWCMPVCSPAQLMQRGQRGAMAGGVGSGGGGEGSLDFVRLWGSTITNGVGWCFQSRGL